MSQKIRIDQKGSGAAVGRYSSARQQHGSAKKIGPARRRAKRPRHCGVSVCGAAVGEILVVGLPYRRRRAANDRRRSGPEVFDGG